MARCEVCASEQRREALRRPCVREPPVFEEKPFYLEAFADRSVEKGPQGDVLLGWKTRELLVGELSERRRPGRHAPRVADVRASWLILHIDHPTTLVHANRAELLWSVRGEHPEEHIRLAGVQLLAH